MHPIPFACREDDAYSVSAESFRSHSSSGSEEPDVAVHDNVEVVDDDSDDEEEEEKDDLIRRSFRWSTRLRTHMVTHSLRRLGWSRAAQLRNPEKKWPKANTKVNKEDEPYKPEWLELRSTVMSELKEELGRDVRVEETPSVRCVRDAARSWTRRFLQEGHVRDRPPHYKGYKLQRNKEHLEKIRNMILEGYPDGNGNTRLYRDLHHLQRVKKEEFKVIREACGLKTMRGLMNQLQAVFPAIQRVAVRFKKDRMREPVQVCFY